MPKTKFMAEYRNSELKAEIPEPDDGRMAVIVDVEQTPVLICRDDESAAEERDALPVERWYTEPNVHPDTWAHRLKYAVAVYQVSPEPMAPVVPLEQAARGAQ